MIEDILKKQVVNKTQKKQLMAILEADNQEEESERWQVSNFPCHFI